MVERGFWKALIRITKQFASLSLVFELFTTQVYTHSILSNFAFGGARYISTGRGFATTRIGFSALFSRYAGSCIYLGAHSLICLLYATLTLRTPWLFYLWFFALSLCIAPFVFNPHQFAWSDFITDYRQVFRTSVSRFNTHSCSSDTS